MKSLRPSHREDKRYLLMQGKDANKSNIESLILDFVGILGFSEACPTIINQNKRGIILSINRKSLEKIRSSIIMSEKDIRIIKVSGSVKKLKD